MANENDNHVGPESASEPPTDEDTGIPVEQAGSLEDQLQATRAQAAEYLEGWQRARAEFANFKRRTENEREEVTRLANSGLVYQLLPILDDLKRAEETLPDDLRHLDWVDGVLMVARKLQTTLESAGLAPIQALGEPFDPNYHDAMIYAPVDDPAMSDRVVEELQKGYLFGGKVLRPTMVKVGRTE